MKGRYKLEVTEKRLETCPESYRGKAECHIDCHRKGGEIGAVLIVTEERLGSPLLTVAGESLGALLTG